MVQNSSSASPRPPARRSCTAVGRLLASTAARTAWRPNCHPVLRRSKGWRADPGASCLTRALRAAMPSRPRLQAMSLHEVPRVSEYADDTDRTVRSRRRNQGSGTVSSSARLGTVAPGGIPLPGIGIDSSLDDSANGVGRRRFVAERWPSALTAGDDHLFFKERLIFRHSRRRGLVQ